MKKYKNFQFLSLVSILSLFLLSPAIAETVYVKYRGPVDLKNFQCAQPSSSFVHRICYQSDLKYLIVLLDKTYYHYCNMPNTVVRQWLGAPSQGKFYRSYVKGRYDCRLVGVPN